MPKLRASTSSPHSGQSSLCLVWALLRYRLQYPCTYKTGFIVTFLTHALVTWNAVVKQMLVYIINVYLILNYVDPSYTSSDSVSAESDGKQQMLLRSPCQCHPTSFSTHHVSPDSCSTLLPQVPSHAMHVPSRSMYPPYQPHLTSAEPASVHHCQSTARSVEVAVPLQRYPSIVATRLLSLISWSLWLSAMLREYPILIQVIIPHSYLRLGLVSLCPPMFAAVDKVSSRSEASLEEPYVCLAPRSS